jgi:hypothetical protein
MLTDDAHSSLDWRWRQTLELVRHPIAERDIPDDWVRLAVATLCAPANNRRDSAFLDGKSEYITAAIQLHEAGGVTCAVLQARLLAGETNEAIAAKLGIAPETVEAYEALLFCVCDRLAAHDWVASQVLGLYPWLAASRADRMNLVRIFGYFAGPLAVDLWWAYFTGASLAEYGPDAEVRARLDLLARMWSQPMTDLSATLRVLAEYQKLLKTDRRRSASATVVSKDSPPLDISAAVSSEIHIEVETSDPAQTQGTAVDAA